MLSTGRALLIVALAIAVYGDRRLALRRAAAQRGRRGRARGGAWIASGPARGLRAGRHRSRSASRCSRLAFLRSDFSFELVATHSSTTTPAFYRATAVWSSQEGSLLLWVLLLSAWSSAILFLTRRRARAIAPYATAVLLASRPSSAAS